MQSDSLRRIDRQYTIATTGLCGPVQFNGRQVQLVGTYRDSREMCRFERCRRRRRSETIIYTNSDLGIKGRLLCRASQFAYVINYYPYIIYRVEKNKSRCSQTMKSNFHLITVAASTIVAAVHIDTHYNFKVKRKQTIVILLCAEQIKRKIKTFLALKFLKIPLDRYIIVMITINDLSSADNRYQVY